LLKGEQSIILATLLTDGLVFIPMPPSGVDIMGFGGISIWQLLIVLVIVVMVFGTKKLRNLGGDLGGALKGFKEAVKPDEDEKIENKENIDTVATRTIDTEAEKELDHK